MRDDIHSNLLDDGSVLMTSFYSPISLAWRGADIVDVCAVHATYGHLLVLTADGGLHGVDMASGAVTPLCQVTLPVFEPDDGVSCFGRRGLRLHGSTNGEFAAIVVDRGRAGLLVSIAGGEVTMPLDGGGYHEDTVPFSAAFVRHERRDMLIHRTAWNRLEASDAATGALLTERYIAPYESGQPSPAHYIDYFRGRLHVSPEGGRIFDDGWVWHPVAIGRVWSPSNWLHQNPWESEDGPSLVRTSQREDWNRPGCWIDEDQFALWGLAEWDYEEFEEINQGAGVCIFDFRANPEPTMRRRPMELNDGTTRRVPMELNGAKVLDLFSDGRHLFVAAETGTTAWDIASGTQVAACADFVARFYDRTRGRLVAFGPDTITEWTLRPELS